MKKRSLLKFTAVFFVVLSVLGNTFLKSPFSAEAALKMPEASGKEVYSNNKASIDASNVSDGYVMVRYADGTSSSRLKVIINGPNSTKYTYDLAQSGNFEVFPLSAGDGEYKVSVYQNTTGTKYASLLSKSITVKLKDQFAPFLIPNQFVNYKSDSKVVLKASELISGKTEVLDKTAVIYDYVINNFTYDKQKAATVKSGYVPDVDEIFVLKKGICFDYASVMSAMLRSQGIPTKLVVGYAGTIYHAWISVYSSKEGWIENVIYFDGKTWKLMDPTFASNGKSSSAIMQYIGNGNNYSAKYYY
ncbi:MAG: transglutaminase-like domain-containing protein [Lachnospiraceae bacterium]|nr:transglutaminase-like domain-containing protein [Lachnospiraceae bacterium]